MPAKVLTFQLRLLERYLFQIPAIVSLSTPLTDKGYLEGARVIESVHGTFLSFKDLKVVMDSVYSFCAQWSISSEVDNEVI